MVATLPGISHPADLAPPRQYLVADLLEPSIEISQGSIRLSDSPGFGFSLDPSAVARATVAAARFGSRLRPIVVSDSE